MLDELRAWLRRHPRWIGAVFLFCLYMTFIYMPFDIFAKLFFQEISEAEEVWFGVLLRGRAAKATEPLHWLIYGALAWGFWKERAWIGWASSLYVAQIAIGMLLWNLREVEGVRGALAGGASFVLFGALGLALWRSRSRFAS